MATEGLRKSFPPQSWGQCSWRSLGVMLSCLGALQYSWDTLLGSKGWNYLPRVERQTRWAEAFLPPIIPVPLNEITIPPRVRTKLLRGGHAVHSDPSYPCFSSYQEQIIFTGSEVHTAREEAPGQRMVFLPCKSLPGAFSLPRQTPKQAGFKFYSQVSLMQGPGGSLAWGLTAWQ